MNKYLFTSKRLGFRNWETTDINLLHKINSDKKAMHYFPSLQTKEETKNFVKKMQLQYTTKGFCYFAVDILKSKEFIGFIGLSEQKFKSDFTPTIDIGWRLHPNFWSKGYATEGAKRCLDFGFKELNLQEIIATAPKINLPSIRVMQKIGMQKIKEFKHPLLVNFPKLENCILYGYNNKLLLLK